VFRKHTGMNHEVFGVDTDTSSRETQTEQGRNGGAIFVANFPPLMTQEELLEAMEPFGDYEKFVMRMSFALPLLVDSLSGLIIIL
jgi:hypothetical protein